MKKTLLPVAAVTAILAVAASTTCMGKSIHAKPAVTPTCEKAVPESQTPVDPTILAGSGLMPDPLAPGGARPVENSQYGAYPSITTMPTTSYPEAVPSTTASPITGGSLEKDPSCP